MCRLYMIVHCNFDPSQEKVEASCRLRDAWHETFNFQVPQQNVEFIELFYLLAPI